MNSNLFNVNIKDITGAVISGVIVAVLGYIGSSADIFSLDWGAILNVAVLAMVSSLVKSFATNSDGKFGGIIQVK